MKPRALVLLGHPDPRSFNAALASAYATGFREGVGEDDDGAADAGSSARVVDLSKLAFDPILRGGHDGVQALEPDLVDLRAGFEAAAHVAWFFPVYWGAPPALVRGLIDRLFLPGWAFRYRGHALPEGLLRGRSARVVSTMDSPGFWYALAHRGSVHAVMGTATLRFCGFDPVRFTMLHAVRAMSADVRSRWLERVHALGADDARRAARAIARRAPKLGAPGEPTLASPSR